MNTLSKAIAAISKIILSVLLGFIYSQKGMAQVPPMLEKLVTINVQNQSVAEVFKSITQQTGVTFSYNSQQFDDKQKISLSVINKPLRVALESIFKPFPCKYNLKKKYVIIQCTSANKPIKKSTYTISGYIVNAADSSRIPNASVFVKSTRQAVITDNYGYFKLIASKSLNPVVVSIAKEEYIDTIILIDGAVDKEVWVNIRPKKKDDKTITKTTFTDTINTAPATPVVYSKPIDTTKTVPPTNNFWEKQKRINANLRNISDTLFSKISFSLVPSISTNKLLSANTINDVAINVLIGKSKGVKYLELAGLFNINNGDVENVQVAGLGNYVAGNVKYVQAGGLFNSVLGRVEGFQAGGLYNIVMQDVEGVQAGGIFNHARAFKGVQLGGIYNYVKDSVEGLQAAGIFNHTYFMHGLQMGGIYNFVKDSVQGMQTAGILNYTRAIEGLQIAGMENILVDSSEGLQIGGIHNHARVLEGFQIGGIANTAVGMEGFQIAGVINVAKNMEGIQIAGLINVAKKIKGLQISVFNFADTCNGLPIGVFSYVHRGYHKIELTADELQLANFGFRTGVAKFHNIVFAGYNGFHTQKFWTYGYGIGSYLYLTPKKGLQFDITAQQLQNTNPGEIKSNILSKLYVGYSYSVAKKFSITLGPTFNVLQQDKNDIAFSNAFAQVTPHAFYNSSVGASNIKMWAGGKLSIKIF